MTSRQAELINIMLSQHYNSATYKDAYSELRGTCSDALVQPTVTVSASGTANQHPPSTPKPLGPEWWKERQAEALKEQIDIIADKNLKIETLTNQVELLKKQIEEDKEHWQKKRAIDTGYRNHANELVLANKEIIDALRHWGLRNEGSLVSNVICVIKLCAERGKEIEELKKDRNASIIASNQILASLNRTGLRQYHGSLADNVVSVINQCEAQEKQIEALKKEVIDRNDEIAKLKGRIEVLDRMAKASRQFDETDRELINKKDKEIESLKNQIEVRLHFTQQDREIIAKRNTEIAELRAQVARICKENDKQGATIRVLNDQLNQSHKQIAEINKHEKDHNDTVESLRKQIEIRKGFHDRDREIMSELRKQISDLSKQIDGRDMTIAVLNKEIDQTGKLCDEEMRETERLKKELEVAGKKRKVIVEAGNRLRDTLLEIRSYNKLLMGEELISDQAIQLWEDNTTP